MSTFLPELRQSAASRHSRAARMGSANERVPVEAKAARKKSSTTASPAPGWERVVAELVAERGAALHRYAFLLCGNADDAADIVQDALVKTFGRLRNGFTVSSAEAYVRKAVLNTYLDRGRKRSRWHRIAHLEVVPESRGSEAPSSDLRLDLHRRLHELFPRERACIVLRYYEDLKVDDIADHLGISSGAVKRYLSDALAKLAISLSNDNDGNTRAEGGTRYGY